MKKRIVCTIANSIVETYNIAHEIMWVDLKLDFLKMAYKSDFFYIM